VLANLKIKGYRGYQESNVIGATKLIFP